MILEITMQVRNYLERHKIFKNPVINLKQEINFHETSD